MPSVNMLPHRITLNAKTTTNTNGGQVVTYAASYSNVPALISPASANLRLIYQQRNIQVTHEIYVAKAITINTGDLVAYGSRNFMVKGFRNILEGGRMYVLDCYEILGTEEIAADFSG